MDLFLAVTAGLLLLTGLTGAVVPVIPGPPLAWAGLLAAYFSSYCQVTPRALIIAGAFAILVTLLDSFLPAIMTKRFGGSKAAVIGSTVGLVFAMIAGPAWIIPGAFIGAFIGELIHNRGKSQGVFKAALGSFIGFLCGTGIKIICIAAFIWYFIFSIVQ